MLQKGRKGRPMAVHAKHHHHVSHPPRASAGKGVLGPAPVGKGILGNAPPGKGILGNAPPGRGISGSGPVVVRRDGIVPPRQWSSHHKPSEALYGNTAQFKRSAASSSIPHKPHAGGDAHLVRKPAAVHAGIPHANKLPASGKDITVRCTWSNNVASPVHRTVTQTLRNDQTSMPATQVYRPPEPMSLPAAQVYRPPTPPQRKTEIDFLPGCHDEKVCRKLEQMSLRAPPNALVFIAVCVYVRYMCLTPLVVWQDST